MTQRERKLEAGTEPFKVTGDIMLQWQELVNAMAILMGIPSGLIMRLKDDRIEVFTTSSTDGNPYEKEASEQFFNSGLYCETVIRTNERLHVPNALEDENWKDNPDVELNMISYLGFPINLPDATPFGTLCILDSKTRHFTQEQEHMLVQFRDMIESQIQLIVSMKELAASNELMKSSITYASKIQQSILSDTTVLNSFFHDHALIWKPKDVVSGDIYFMRQLNKEEIVIFVIDCTGHGVAGALLTMIVKAIEEQVNYMNQKECLSPKEMLHIFNQEIKTVFSSFEKTDSDFAGFDGGVIHINKRTKVLTFAGAKLPLYMFKKDSGLDTIKPDRSSVGYQTSNKDITYTNHIIKMDDYNGFCISTDGYWDQVGGKKAFSYGKRNFQKLIIKHEKSTSTQIKKEMVASLDEYQGSLKQVDDMTVLLVKF